MNAKIFQRIYNWINERWPLATFIAWGLHEEIPGGTRFSYTLGSSCLFLLIIQIVTGVWQMFFYVPTVDYAYSSLNYLRFEVPFGWLIHGLHYWGAQAFTVVVGLHVIRVFIWGAYKKPRELVWLAGVVLLVMTAMFMFTGPVLPWDKKGYWAAQVGLNMAGSTPFIGSWLQDLLQGSNKLGQIALTRFYVAHVALIPFATVLFVIIHLIAFRVHGSVGPWDTKKAQTTGYFWPEQLFKDVLVWFAIFLLLVFLCVFMPAPLSGLADPMDTFYTPKPEWNFLFLYECLKYFSGPLEPIGTVGIPLVMLMLLLSLPFLDRSPERDPSKRIFVMMAGFCFVMFVVGMTLLGYYGSPSQDVQARTKLSLMKQTEEDIGRRGEEQERAGVRPPGTVQGSAGKENASGEELFKTFGCSQCHSVDGKPSHKQGPDLKTVLNKNVSRQWIWTQLISPEKHNPKTVMPLFSHLSDQQLNAIIDYLQGLVADKPDTTGTEAVLAGEMLFNSLGCIQCHTATGAPSGKAGPDLIMNLGQKTISKEWLRAQLLNPRKHNLSTMMPSYNSLGDHQLDVLVAYLEDLSTRKRQSQQEPKVPVPSKPEADTSNGLGQAIHIVGNWDHGMVLYQQACMRCHGPEGVVNASDVSVLPGVPSLRPIRKEFYKTDIIEFVRSIDPAVQHGVSNKSGGPDMPAFGDTYELTQAQIADIEAYILHINGVSRDRIINPGVEPKTFLYVLLTLSAGLGVILWMLYRQGR